MDRVRDYAHEIHLGWWVYQLSSVGNWESGLWGSFIALPLTGMDQVAWLFSICIIYTVLAQGELQGIIHLYSCIVLWPVSKDGMLVQDGIIQLNKSLNCFYCYVHLMIIHYVT